MQPSPPSPDRWRPWIRRGFVGIVFATCCALAWIATNGDEGERAVLICLVFAVGNIEAGKILERR